MEIDNLIDRFVDEINSSLRGPVDVKDTPLSVCIGEPDEYGECDWRVKPFDGIDWIEPLEACLPFKIPRLYRSLVMRYIFPAFEFGPIFFFANTPEGSAYFEFRKRLFSDGFMSSKLLEGGYLQFGNPDMGGYDPVCFDLNRSSGNDAPIVQIDHEEIPCNDRILVIAQLAPSFADLITTLVRNDGD